MKIGIGIGLTTRQGVSGPPTIITATVAPSLGPLEDGDTIASAMSANYDQTSNYSSAAGTISTVVAAATVNGVAALFTDTVDAGDVVAVTVTITDSEANERVFNAGSRTVAGIAPTNDVAPSIAGDTSLGDTLTVTAGTWTGAPAPTLAYQWLRGGVEITGETGTTYDITLADSGAEITVRETATNSEGSGSAVSNAITADTFTAPVNTVAPSIGGDTAVGSTLTRTTGTWTGNPTPTLSGQWQRDGANISGATAATYVTVEADEGADITYLETATNAVGSASQASNAITVTAASAFTPASLFASGEEGAWYEPSTTTAFRSTTDLTPCGYGGTDGVCGFLLDLSKGAGYSGGAFTGLGSELVTNGTFATNDLTGWIDASSGGTVSVSNEQVTLSRTAGTARLRQATTVEVGKTYLFSFDLINTNPTNRAAVYVGSTATGSDLLVPQPPIQGTNSYVLTATTTTIGMTFYTETIGFDPIFDNISVKELPRNHATQATAAARPILARVPETGRRNLLERTEEFDDAYWGKADATVSSNAGTAPDGTTTADKVIVNSGRPDGSVRRAFSFVGGTSYALSVYAKVVDTGFDVIAFTVEAQAAINFNLTTLSPTITAELNGWTITSPSIESVGSGWYRCSAVFNAATTVTQNARMAEVRETGDGTSGILFWGAQLEAASSATAYQKVVDQYDITEAGVTSIDYLFDDEVDDAISWTAPADTDYTIARVDTGGNVTILTGQSLSGATDILLEQDIAGYVAVDRVLTSQETTDLTTYLEALV